jgi:hypothetical protein
VKLFLIDWGFFGDWRGEFSGVCKVLLGDMAKVMYRIAVRKTLCCTRASSRARVDLN